MTLQTSPKLIVVIPALNEVLTIEHVVKRVKPYADEVIVVDDGSSDETSIRAKEAGAFVVRNKTTTGYEGAIENGFREALKRNAEIIVTFDADSQHRPEDIKRLTKPIVTKEADVAVGQRQYLSHFAERIFSLYTNFRFGIKDPLCGLKAYSRKVYESIGHFDTLGLIGAQLLIEAMLRGFRVCFIPVDTVQRLDRSRFYHNRLKANYKFVKALIKVILFLPK